jgi:hypothetical protein
MRYERCTRGGEEARMIGKLLLVLVATTSACSERNRVASHGLETAEYGLASYGLETAEYGGKCPAGQSTYTVGQECSYLSGPNPDEDALPKVTAARCVIGELDRDTGIPNLTLICTVTPPCTFEVYNQTSECASKFDAMRRCPAASPTDAQRTSVLGPLDLRFDAGPSPAIGLCNGDEVALDACKRMAKKNGAVYSDARASCFAGRPAPAFWTTNGLVTCCVADDPPT